MYKLTLNCIAVEANFYSIMIMVPAFNGPGFDFRPGVGKDVVKMIYCYIHMT